MSSQDDILNQIANFKAGYEYGLGGNGTKDSDHDGKLNIDCSNLVNQILQGAGFDVPYQYTGALANSKYFEEVDAENVRPGDIILWNDVHHHTGVVTQYNSDGSGKFFGSQSSTGPDETGFDGKHDYWKNPTKFLRPIDGYKLETNDSSAPVIHNNVAPPKPVAVQHFEDGVNGILGQADAWLNKIGNKIDNATQKIVDWAEKEVSNIEQGLSNSGFDLSKIGLSANGDTTTISSTNGQVSFNQKTGVIQTSQQESMPTGNIGSTSGETSMMNTFDLATGQLIGTAQSYSDPNQGLSTPLSATTDHLSNALHAGTVNNSSTLGSSIFYTSTDTNKSSFGEIFSIRSLVGAQGANETWGGQSLLGLSTVGAPDLEFNWGGWSASSNSVVQFSNPTHFLSGTSFASFGNTFNLNDPLNFGMIYGDSYYSTGSSGHLYLDNDSEGDGYSFGDSFQFGPAFPIVLDLNGNGVEFINQSDSFAFFDFDDTGYRTHTGWISANDAFLTIDSNHNGKIDQAKELALSQWTADANDTDLDALKAVFDTNHDNKLDAQDSSFADFRVWQDKNGDGVSDAAELKTLTEAGITSFDLNATDVNWISGGNAVLGLGDYTKADGTTATFADAGLGHDEDGWKLQAMTGYQQLTKADGMVYAVVNGIAGLTLNLTTLKLDGVMGGDGADKLITTATAKTAVMLQGNAGNDSLVGGSGDDWLEGGAGSDTMSGGAGDDTLLIDAADKIANITGGAGFDIAVVQGAVGVTMNLDTQGFESAIGSDGNDNFSTALDNRVVLAGQDGKDTLSGSNGTDVLEGGTGSDVLQGKAGDDYYQFNRGDGVDEISDEYLAHIAHQGNNVYIEKVWDGLQFVSRFANHYYIYYTDEQVNAGSDTLLLGADITLKDIVLAKSGADMVVGLQQSDATTAITDLTDRVILKNWDVVNKRVETIELADGSCYNIADWKTGTAGNDALTGDAAANVLSGLAGADTMNGGGGNDAYAVDSIGDVVIEAANQGTDLVESTITYTLGANVENLTLVGTASINGTGNELNSTMIGNDAANVLSGGAGHDTLIGAGGSDSMLGGLGDDTYIVDIDTDLITENANEGIDTVQSRVSTVLSANVENLTLTGLAVINGTGNALDNLMTGNQANNVLKGGAGNDTLIGGGSDDSLMGGADNDVYTVEVIGDVVTENLDEGTDLVNVAIATLAGSYTLSDNVENATVTSTVAFTLNGNALNNSLTGNAAANTLIGGAGDDILDGLTGSDSMVGGTGNDTYVINVSTDKAIENTDEGIDTVLSSITLILATNLENLTLSGLTAINGTGNMLNNIIVGNAANNALSGLAGNDILVGGAGTNVLIGGEGDDLYMVTSATDVITELATVNAGFDTVESSVNFTLAANIEKLTLIGTENINATGNATANTITGNGANNIINGLAGNDSMAGGFGNDTYTIDVLTDSITENVNAGIDTVNVAIATANGAYTLGNNLENGIITNVVAYSLVGNELDNILIGNAYANKLIGGAGNDNLDGAAGIDTMQGGYGNDSYVLNISTDVVIENANEGLDTAAIAYNNAATTASTLTLGIGNFINIENLTITGTGLYNLMGSDANNILVGNASANVINAGAGTDTLYGGLGNDTLDGGLSADTFVFNTALSVTNVDKILTFNSTDDTIQLDSGIFAKLSAGTLNAANFVIGSVAMDADDYIIYNSTTGDLYYDKDGIGSTAAVKFAILDSHPTINMNDIVVF